MPRENVKAWLQHLRRSFPTLPFKSSTQSQRHNLSSGVSNQAAAAVSASTSTKPLLSLLKNYARYSSSSKDSGPSVNVKATITVGVIGMPNVGKSSLINTLKRSRACGVAPTPGFTKNVQEVALDASLKILDCPGIVLEGGDDGPEQILRNSLRIEKVADPIGPGLHAFPALNQKMSPLIIWSSDSGCHPVTLPTRTSHDAVQCPRFRHHFRVPYICCSRSRAIEKGMDSTRRATAFQI